MNEPAAIYGMQGIVFDKGISNTQNIILSQGREALKAVIRRILQLEEYANSNPIKNAGIDERTHSIISDLCYQAGLASTILLNEAKKGDKESDLAYRLRIKRVKYVKTFCDSEKIELKVLKDRGVRNALTHIDERLADILTEKENVGWFIDVALGPQGWNTKDEIEMKFCRCYDITTRRILHLEHELSVPELYEECMALLAVVFGVDGKGITNRTEQCR
jgi:hypothetical protein